MNKHILVFFLSVGASVLADQELLAQTDDACVKRCLFSIQWTTPYEQQYREQQERYRQEWQERNDQYQRDQQNRQNQQGPRAGGSYGALAYSPKTGDYGYSYGFGNRKLAEQRAKRECGKDDCEIAAWYSKACGAVAAGDDGKWGGGSGDNESLARADAKADCEKDGGKNCEIVVSKCTR
jgi:Domain of unknown function (DUF4189)